MIAEFRRVHHKREKWEDAKELHFRRREHHAIERPGVRPGMRWKFTFQVPDGFHYNVVHSRGGGFEIPNENGIPQRFRKRTNVDCHGFVRGGR